MIHVILKTKLVKLKLVKVLAQLLHEHHIMFSFILLFLLLNVRPQQGDDYDIVICAALSFQSSLSTSGDWY